MTVFIIAVTLKILDFVSRLVLSAVDNWFIG